MRISILLFTGLLVISAVSTCYYDSEEYLYPQLYQCDSTATITFEKSVLPILRNDCFECHSNKTAPGISNIKLENYDDVKARALKGRTPSNKGSLLGSISYSKDYKHMPEIKPKLEDCKITTIEKWIVADFPK
jgi:hypothetical protein